LKKNTININIFLVFTILSFLVYEFFPFIYVEAPFIVYLFIFGISPLIVNIGLFYTTNQYKISRDIRLGLYIIVHIIFLLFLYIPMAEGIFNDYLFFQAYFLIACLNIIYSIVVCIRTSLSKDSAK